jgi:hypothetical protein
MKISLCFSIRMCVTESRDRQNGVTRTSLQNGVTRTSLKEFQTRKWRENMQYAQVISLVPEKEMLSELQSLLLLSILCGLSWDTNTPIRKWKLWLDIGQFSVTFPQAQAARRTVQRKMLNGAKSETSSCCTLFGHRVYTNLNHITWWTETVFAFLDQWRALLNTALNQRFGRMYCLHLRAEGGSMFLQNVIYLQVHTALLPRRPTSICAVMLLRKNDSADKNNSQRWIIKSSS